MPYVTFRSRGDHCYVTVNGRIHTFVGPSSVSDAIRYVASISGAYIEIMRLKAGGKRG